MSFFSRLIWPRTKVSKTPPSILSPASVAQRLTTTEAKADEPEPAAPTRPNPSPEPAVVSQAAPSPARAFQGGWAILDVRTDEDRQIAADGQSGNVTSDIERVVDEIVDLSRRCELMAWGLKAGEPCGHCTTSELALEGGTIVCRNCGRRSALEDYDEEKRHKRMVEIGAKLHEEGGRQLMQLVAYRFRARGGNANHLSWSWHGVGHWRH